jgi:hypothetical protein
MRAVDGRAAAVLAPPAQRDGVREPGQRRRNGFSHAARLWSALPREVGTRFRRIAEPMAKDMVVEIRRAVPEYAQPLDSYGQAVVDAVRFAVTSSIDSIGNPTIPYEQHERWADFCRYMGRREFADGRTMDSLQTAARVGGRVAWRHIAEFSQSIHAPAEIIATAAEAVFAYVDELSALAIEGFTEAQAHAAGTVERRRRRLVELILAEPAVSSQAVMALADAARWKVPDRIAVVALEIRADQHERPAPMLDSEVLLDLEGEQPCLITPDPDRFLNDLESELQGWRACVGPTVPLSDARVSLRWARRAMGLVERGVIPDRPLTWCRDHIATLWLLADEFLIGQLATRSLAPLDSLTTKQRARLAETLLTWLRTRGSAPEIANELSVHPQTVRYRMHQLQNLFGDRLNNPDDRLEMEIALRAEQLLNPRAEKEPVGAAD